MAARKKPAETPAEEPSVQDQLAAETPAEEPSVEEQLEAAKESAKFIDLDSGTRPSDGDLCLVKVFDHEKQRQAAGPACIFDAHRGVFFKDPEHGGGGSVVGPRRDNYKAERVRNVTAFAVVIEAHDPAPEPDSVIDHARGLEYASKAPPPIMTPPASPD